MTIDEKNERFHKPAKKRRATALESELAAHKEAVRVLAEELQQRIAYGENPDTLGLFDKVCRAFATRRNNPICKAAIDAAGRETT